MYNKHNFMKLSPDYFKKHEDNEKKNNILKKMLIKTM